MNDKDKYEDLEKYLIQDAVSSEGTFEMIGGCMYEKDGKQVLLNKVTLDEVSGVEEDILAGRGSDFTSKFYRVLVSCTKALSSKDGSVVIESKGELRKVYKDLSISDQVYLLFLLRIISVEDGNIFRFKVACPFCQPKRFLMRSVNLNELEIKRMKEPEKRVYDYTTKSGNTFRCSVMTAASDAKVGAKKDDIATRVISSRVLEMNGNPVKFSDLKKLKLRERSELRRAFEEKEGGVDTKVTIDCEVCGAEFDTQIDITQGNFFSQ